MLLYYNFFSLIKSLHFNKILNSTLCSLTLFRFKDMEFLEVLTEGLERVLLVRGGGREVITIYSWYGTLHYNLQVFYPRFQSRDLFKILFWEVLKEDQALAHLEHPQHLVFSRSSVLAHHPKLDLLLLVWKS